MEDNSDAKLDNLLLYSQVAEDMPKGDVGQEGSPNQTKSIDGGLSRRCDAVWGEYEDK